MDDEPGRVPGTGWKPRGTRKGVGIVRSVVRLGK
jgi:hypothetical protein